MKKLTFDRAQKNNDKLVLNYVFKYTDNTINNIIIRTANDSYISDKDFNFILFSFCQVNNLPYLNLGFNNFRNVIIHKSKDLLK